MTYDYFLSVRLEEAESVFESCIVFFLSVVFVAELSEIVTFRLLVPSVGYFVSLLDCLSRIGVTILSATLSVLVGALTRELLTPILDA